MTTFDRVHLPLVVALGLAAGICLFGGGPMACMSLSDGGGVVADDDDDNADTSDDDDDDDTTGADDDDDDMSTSNEADDSADDDDDDDDGDDDDDDVSSSSSEGESSSTGQGDDDDDDNDDDDVTTEDTTTSEQTTSDETTTVPEITGNVEIAIATNAFGGRYSPRNVGAIWIETSDGQYLRTLQFWAGIRKRHLHHWLDASANDPSAADAMSGATQGSHTIHEATWDRMDAEGNEHKEGDYLLRAEFTELAGEGVQISLPFTIGNGAGTSTPQGDENFSDIEITVPG